MRNQLGNSGIRPMKTFSDNRTLLSRSPRWFGGVTLRVGIAAVALASAASAGTIGQVVPIGGQASDIALDETRGVLYIANFAANRIASIWCASQAAHRTSSSI